MMSNKKLFSDKWDERGIENIYPSKEDLRKFIKAGNKLDLFWGIDPTGTTLHIGHGTIMLKLRKLQAEGHKIRILIGDFTAQIGDPTDKKSARVKLTPVEVKENYKKYRAQIGKILDLSKVEFVFNNDWLKKMTFSEVIELASEFTVAQMIERDMFQERLKKGEPIYLHEFLYPLMQGYDSVVLDVNAEIGANDQTFNMLAGRTMMKKRDKEKFVIATKLLVDPTGKKMGKTEGNMVTLEDSPTQMYGKVMSWPDLLMPLAYEICTELSSDEVEKVLSGHPRDAKMRLAREVVANFSGEKDVEKAEKDFIDKFQNQTVPENIKEYKIEKGTLLKDFLIKNKILPSTSEFKRLVEGGGVSTFPKQIKIKEINFTIREKVVIRVGKKVFIKITLKK